MVTGKFMVTGEGGAQEEASGPLARKGEAVVVV
jgi:hypothetical protein